LSVRQITTNPIDQTHERSQRERGVESSITPMNPIHREADRIASACERLEQSAFSQ
jgi:hypothetical protein